MKRIILLLVFILSASSYAQIAETAEEVCPLLIGEMIPSTLVASIDNTEISLPELFKKQPAVLLFYRGGWCPFCNTHLASVGEITKEISELGYQIIGISPDSPEKLKESITYQKLEYQLLSDAYGDLVISMGLAFKSPEKYGAMLLDVSGGANKGFLPVPALYIVDTDGIIKFQYVSPDYKERISSEMLLAVLKSINSKID